MKKSIIILSALTMTVASFKTIRPEDRKLNSDAAAERMAQSVVNAFKHRSLEEYTALFPQVTSFLDLMDRNANFYGTNLEEAKKEFEIQYTREVLPALKQSFHAILAEGRKAGIDWTTIQLIRVDLGSKNEPTIITFSSQEREYHLQFKSPLLINGEWKVSQHVALV
jgi:hypothetical protein